MSSALCSDCLALDWASAKPEDGWRIHKREGDNVWPTLRERLKGQQSCALCRLLCKFISQANGAVEEFMEKEVVLSADVPFYDPPDKDRHADVRIGLYAEVYGIRMGFGGVPVADLTARYPVFRRSLPLLGDPGIPTYPLTPVFTVRLWPRPRSLQPQHDLFAFDCMDRLDWLTIAARRSGPCRPTS